MIRKKINIDENTNNKIHNHVSCVQKRKRRLPFKIFILILKTCQNEILACLMLLAIVQFCSTGYCGDGCQHENWERYTDQYVTLRLESHFTLHAYLAFTQPHNCHFWHLYTVSNSLLPFGLIGISVGSGEEKGFPVFYPKG